MSTGTAVVVALAVGALGFYLGAKYAVGQVHEGALGGVDSIIGALGGNPNTSYGRAAHNIFDVGLGAALGG